MAIKRNSNLCIVRTVFGTEVEINLTEAEVRALYDEVCRRSQKNQIGVLRSVLGAKYNNKEVPRMPNEHEVSK